MTSSQKFIGRTGRVPLIAEADVVVLGGGPSGVAAAVCAARLGADVILLERYGYFGGQATGGLVIEFVGTHDGTPDNPGRPIKAGFYQEVLVRLQSLDAVTRFPDVTIHPEMLKLVYQRLVLEAGVEPLAHTWAVDATVKGDTIETIIVGSKSGLGAVAGRVFIDATGDADSAEWCQIPFEKLPPDDLSRVTLVYRFGNVDLERIEKFVDDHKEEYGQILSQAKDDLGFRLNWHPTMNPGEVWTNEAHIQGIDCSNTADLVRSELKGREMAYLALQFYREHVPGFEKACWVDTAPQMGVRESRRVRTQYWLTLQDVIARRMFVDTVVLENHHRRVGPPHIYSVPYRCLVPPDIKNLLFTGRCVGVAHEIAGRVRDVASCMCLGQAAGTGAALAAEAGCDVGQVDAGELHKLLLDAGAILDY